jgi:predicted aspartyl protease
MNSFPFTLLDGGSLILLDGMLDGEKIIWALDTAASHTIVDLTKLILAGYSIDDMDATVQFETGKGIVDAQTLTVKKLQALGITLENAEVSAYDFLAHGIVSEYDGLLGLDFFMGRKVCIDLQNMLITI